MIIKSIKYFFRSVKQAPASFFVNLIGLSTALACAFLIFIWVHHETSIDKFNDKDDQLFQVMGIGRYGDAVWVQRVLPPVLAETLLGSIPEVDYAINEAIIPAELRLSKDNIHIKAQGRYGDEDYFNVFSYELKYGDKKQVLADLNNIAISTELAIRLFKDIDQAIGKFIEFEDKGLFKVSGIFEVPPNVSERFDFLLPYKNVFKFFPNFRNDWSNSDSFTHLILAEGTNIEEFNKKMNAAVEGRQQGIELELFVRPYSSGYLYGGYSNGVQSGGRIEDVRLFIYISIFILFIACINFINLSTAEISRRVRQIGIRKSLGARKSAIFFRYLLESVFISLCSAVVAMVLVLLILPGFSDVVGKELNLDLTVITFPFLAISILVGLLAGGYPALYMAGIDAKKALKGEFKASVRNIMIRKGLIVFQFLLSTFMIVAVFVFYNQMKLIRSENLGYDKENVIFFEMEGKVASSREVFIERVKGISGVEKVSSIWLNIIGNLNSTSAISWPGKAADDQVGMQYRRVNYDLLELMGIEILQGESFSKKYSSERRQLIFNQTAIDKMGIEDPIGKKVTLFGESHEILGVVKDFYFQSLHSDISPLMFLLLPDRTNTIMMKVKNQNMSQAISDLEELHADFTGGLPIDIRFLDEKVEEQYASEKIVSVLIRYAAGLAIIISCLGLYGLTSFLVEKRTKEMAIRKTLGARNSSLFMLITSEFNKLVIISLILSLPLSYFMAKEWLDNFVLKISLGTWYFLGAAVCTFIVTWFAIVLQFGKLLRLTIVSALRSNE